ncbi:MAG: hypothetical protein FWC52_01810 [Candidatus Methanoplasma sp.]|nr:hypothetical protein [Candidatus Methanoplasma sp.]
MANCVLKDYILKRYAVSERFECIEGRVAETEKKTISSSELLCHPSKEY